MVPPTRWLRALTLSAATTLALAAVALAPFSATAANAAASATTAAPSTVTSDALPTVQVDGVVWSQVIVGNTVYAGGSFATAQPSGAAAGVGTVARADVLAYDLTTGKLIDGFAPSFNAQVRGLAASPDGRTIYAVGDFTTVNGVATSKIVALDASTGAKIASFAAKTNSAGYAVAATANAVYVGGTFTSADGVTRARTAAFAPATGALLPWAPNVADQTVRALVVSPDGSKVVLGGSFTSLNGSSSPGSGLGAVDTSTGASVPWAVGKTIYDHGKNSAIYSLSSDGTNVYGTGYVYGSVADGNLEGSFNAKWSDGSINWIEDCHGDSYSVASLDGAVYVASHAHYCGNVPNGFDQSEDDTSASTKQRALAYSVAPAGTLLKNTYGDSNIYVDFGGTPAPNQLTWYPTITAGTYTGQSQGAWSVAAGNGYVVLGGEFPTVNGGRQAGLVRFAVSAKSTNTDGPQLSGSSWTPTAVSLASGAVRVGWQANTDRDDAQLTYAVLRGSTVVSTSTATSHGWWDTPSLAFTDTGLTPGSTATYRIRATDPDGNSATSAAVSVVVGSTAVGGTSSGYAKAVLADAPTDYWRFDEASGKTVYDRAGSSDLIAETGVTPGATGAIAGDSDTAATFSGGTGAFAATQTLVDAPNTFSVESWFKTTTTSGGKIVGFGNANTGTSGSYDRHVYMDTSGRVLFGVYPNAIATVQSGTGYNDGKWHQVVATLSSTGMQLFLDGKSVASRTDVTQGQSYRGYWRVGGDVSWSGASYFAGGIDDVALYGSALSATQVANHYSAATTGKTNVAPIAQASTSVSGLTVAVDGSGSTDADGKVAGYSWNFGDGSTATTATASHTYAKSGTYAVTLTVTDDGGLTGTASRTIVVSAANTAPTASFTAAADGLSVTTDASGSKDSDGSIASYAWDFGDGSTGAGRTATHAYAKAGSYTVKLIVTDDAGATDSTTKSVTVAAPAAPAQVPFALDAFGRSSGSGLGSADTGGAWTVSGTATNYAVGSGTGQLSTTAGATRLATLGSVSSTSTDLTVSAAVSPIPVGGSAYMTAIGRRVGTDDYRTRVLVAANGAVTIQANHGETALKSATVPGLTYGTGDVLRIRVQVTGTSPTTVRARVWKVGTTEPTTWQVSATDSTASLQSAGGVGIGSYLGGGVTNGKLVFSFDDLVAIDPANG